MRALNITYQNIRDCICLKSSGSLADVTIRDASRASICSTNFNRIPLAGGPLVTASPTIAWATDRPWTGPLLTGLPVERLAVQRHANR